MPKVTPRHPASVAVLIIEHRHGRNVSVCTDESVAERELLEYVELEWAREIPDEVMPTDPALAIARYFAVMRDQRGEEFYEIGMYAVED
jgi:hypothetical protein